MIDQNDFVILYPTQDNEEIVKFKSFFEGYGLNVAILPCQKESLEILIAKKIRTAIVYNVNNSNFAHDFIIEASVRKIFHQTTFYYLGDEKPSNFDQIKLMTLGYSGFLALPFSAIDAQNTIDINDCLMAA
jgi:hypothetical protein